MTRFRWRRFFFDPTTRSEWRWIAAFWAVLMIQRIASGHAFWSAFDAIWMTCALHRQARAPEWA